MQCPIDRTTLQPMDRQGVEIDFCPQCRGVWLDRGELDKLIDRAATAIGGSGSGGPGPRPGLHGYDRPAPRPEYGRGQDYRYRDDDDDDDDDYRRHGRKRRGWLGDIFDF